MKRPTTMDAYIYLIQSALDDVIDLKMSAEYDMEDMGDALGFVDALEHQITSLLDDMKSENYEFKNEDLPFMALVNAQNDLMLPFKHLFRRINDTHRNGLEESI